MTFVAHAGGMGWDELLVFATPVVILGALRIADRRRKAREGGDPEQDEAGDEDEEMA